MKFIEEKKKNASTFQKMVFEKVVSSGSVQKMAGSGLTLSNLVTAYKRDNRDGIKNIFSEIVNGHPRVTKNVKIIQNVNTFIGKIV